MGNGISAEAKTRRVAHNPSGRTGESEDAAAAVVWLCSDVASFVVGHTLVVDGGMPAQ
jgi:NAD(P)-dependent dehydrogenase (short-subunit alcohol dehydrogenase family)